MSMNSRREKRKASKGQRIIVKDNNKQSEYVRPPKYRGKSWI